MANDIDEVVDPQFEAIDEEDLIRMDEEDAITDSFLETQEELPSMEGEQQPQQPTSSTEEEPTQETQQPEPEEEGNALKTTAEAALSIPTGVVDTGIGLYNKVMPGEALDIPNIPRFENEVAQTVRDISSIVVPTVVMTRFGMKGGAAAHSKLGWKLGNDPFFKWFSKTGLAGGAGVVSDSLAPAQERDHNALGMIKKSFPRSTGWISEDLATLDSDGPDLKRQKNIKEGLGIGLLADVLVGAGKLAKSLKGTAKATEWIPENEKAASYIKAMQEEDLSTDAVEDATLKSAKRRYDQTSELGQVNLNQSVNLDEPIFGMHDLYGYTESGIRTGDPDGILGASVDVVRIEQNLDTIYGRVGSVVTPGALQFLTKGNDAGQRLIVQAADILKDSKYGYKFSNGKYLSHAEIVKSGNKIGADLYGLPVEDMKGIIKGLSGVDVDSGAKVLSSEGYAGVMSAIKQYMDDYINMDIVRAQGYIATSLAGQVADMSEGARLFSENPGAVKRAQEQILDRLQYLMQIKGTTSYVRGRALNMLNLGKRAFKKELTMDEMLTAIKDETSLTKEHLKKLTFETNQTIETLRQVSAERPELLRPLQLAYEVTDGKVSTISALNDYIRNTTGVFKKALVDVNPDMPSAWTQGMWANIYNSVLSSIGTPLKAGASNLALMIERPIATLGGALIEGDAATLRRGSYMYTVGMVDTLQKAFSHMNQIFRRSWSDPSSVGYIMREDIARKNEGTMKVLRSYGEAKESVGEYGPSALVAQIEAMNDLSEHPWLRLSANLMTAFDGFTRSFIGSVEARGRAYDKLLKEGGEKALNADSIKKLSNGLYDQMFDERGFITDKAVEYASKEIAMNLENDSVNALSKLIQKYPALKPFLMFPKTSMNMLKFTGSHNPLALFRNELAEFKHPFDMAITNKEQVENLLAARGIPFDENAKAAYETIRAELKGRKAIGTLSVGGAVGLFLSGRIRGNGLYDKTRQKTRRELGWKPLTYQGWDGKWYSYENLGPLSDWLSLTTDIMDNFDTLDETNIETMLNKMGFIISANLTNKSFTAGLEPLNDVLAGNPAALARWGASFGSSFLPGSGFRNELGRLITPSLKEVDQELTQLLANRNVGLKQGLADVYDWVDGGKVGEPENFWQRVVNTYSPWFKQSDRISPEKQFLIDIEWNGRPQLRTNGKGVEYTPSQRSEVTELMGKYGWFKKEIKDIMGSVDGKEFRKLYKNSNVPMDRKLFMRIHMRLNDALRRAKKFAEAHISDQEKVRRKQYINDQIDYLTETGQTEQIRGLLDWQNN